ncbi:MAG TPA: hypothetical protein VKF36_14025 [Syntrophorhabdales bacterium]|nr:hypothetical protein [Syntrophorhabdales bacterium]
MKRLVVVMAVLLAVLLLFGATTGRADDGATVTVLDHVIPVPGFTNFADPANSHGASFDISFVDSDRYYLADRGWATGFDPGRVDVFDARTDVYLYSISGWVGSKGSAGGPTATTLGPNGILVLHTHKDDPGELWGADGIPSGGGPSTVKVADLGTKSIVDSISTGGSQRCDELSYDPIHRVIMVANDADTPPFVTFISQNQFSGGHHKVLGKIIYDGGCTSPPCVSGSPPSQKGHGPNAAPGGSPGLEQSVFDAPYFYFSVPSTVDKPDGEIDVIDPVSMNIVKRFDAPGCNPAGLALGPDHHLVLGCGGQLTLVIDDQTGTPFPTVKQVGGVDEVWYNKGDNRYYLAANACTTAECIAVSPVAFGPGQHPALGVIDAKTNLWVENLATGQSAHSVAVNPTNNHIFVPLTIPVASGSPTVPPILQWKGQTTPPWLGLGIAVFEHVKGEEECDRDRACEEFCRGGDRDHKEWDRR